MGNHKPGRLAWAKLNAYGVLLAGLAIMGVTDLINPGGADLAQLVGGVPPGQPVWVTGFVIAGLMLLRGFLAGDRLAETIGLALILASMVLQTVVAYAYLGWGEFTLTRLALIALVGLCAWARISALWGRDEISIRFATRDDQ